MGKALRLEPADDLVADLHNLSAVYHKMIEPGKKERTAI